MLALGGISARAAETSTTVTIANVTRRYKDAATFLDLCNEYRTANGLKAWQMDTESLEGAMLRATELSIFLSEDCPDGKSGTQYIDASIKNDYIAYGVISLPSLLSDMKRNATANSILLSSDTQAAGIGVVTVNSIKYLALYASNKTVNKVSSTVLSQENRTLNQKVKILESNIGEVSMPFTNGQSIYCGSSIEAYLKVVNKNYSKAYVLLTPDNLTVTISNTDIMKRTGDRIYAVAPGGATVSISLSDIAYIGDACYFKTLARSFTSCTFSSIPDQYYTGVPIRPNVTVKNSSGEVLTLGTDYSLSYLNNLNVGTASVTVKGMGMYAGETKKIYFNIVKKGNTDTTTFTMSISASKSSVTLGQSTIITVNTSGGTAPIKYTYTYAEYGTSNWKTLVSDSTSNQCTFKPSAATKYNVRATATDANNKTATQTTVITVNGIFSITGKLSTTQVAVNNPVTISASYSGGTSPYTYAFYVQKPGESSYTTIRGYNSTNNTTYSPASAGTYKFCIRCKDGNEQTAEAYCSLTATSKTLANNSSVAQSSVTLGQSITIKGSAAGGTSPYTYAYYYKRSSSTKWTLKKDYSTTTSVSFKPQSAGTYNICVRAKDSKGSVAKKFIDVTVKPALVNNSTISATSIANGASVTVTGAASGGSGGYQYALYYKRASVSNYTLGRKYGTGTQMTVTPKYSGDYNVRVKLKDSNGKITNKDFVVKVGPMLSNSSTLAASSIIQGNSVTVNCSAAGGKAPYQYAVFYRQTANPSWTRARDYGTGTAVAVKPKAAVQYTIRVKAKDSAGKIVNKDLTLNVTPSLKNTSALSSATITKGQSVTVNCSATGGKAPYTYAVFYRQADSDSWTKARDYGSGTTVSVTPKRAKAYVVRVKAKDSTGKIVNRDLSLTVK